MRRTKRRQSAQAAAEGMNRSEPMLRKRALMWKDPSTMAHGTTEVKRENCTGFRPLLGDRIDWRRKPLL